MYIDTELLCIIIQHDPFVWKACLTFPYFARWSMTDEGKQKAIELFRTVDIDPNNVTIYRFAGKLHRTDGPAIKFANGNKKWYKHGLLHRLGGPAIIYCNGRKEWYQNNQLHRLDGPAVIHTNKNEYWYQNGKLHRSDGPAIKFFKYKIWYQNDKLQAIEHINREIINNI